MLDGLELSPVGSVHFWRMLFSIGQTQSEEWFQIMEMIWEVMVF